MSKQTPLQQLLKHLETRKKWAEDSKNHLDYFGEYTARIEELEETIYHLKTLLTEEQMQLEEAFEEGGTQATKYYKNEADVHPDNMIEKWFNDKYGK